LKKQNDNIALEVNKQESHSNKFVATISGTAISDPNLKKVQSRFLSQAVYFVSVMR
jgi:aerobic-type carbon monoxide dehydrogenase small subunit (CoxS/CutS family)